MEAYLDRVARLSRRREEETPRARSPQPTCACFPVILPRSYFCKTSGPRSRDNAKDFSLLLKARSFFSFSFFLIVPIRAGSKLRVGSSMCYPMFFCIGSLPCADWDRQLTRKTSIYPLSTKSNSPEVSVRKYMQQPLALVVTDGGIYISNAVSPLPYKPLRFSAAAGEKCWLPSCAAAMMGGAPIKPAI